MERSACAKVRQKSSDFKRYFSSSFSNAYAYSNPILVCQDILAVSLGVNAFKFLGIIL